MNERKISDRTIAEVRERTSIVGVIGDITDLKTAGGGNVKGICPFHDEKTPSLTVSSARNVYFCHGCGAGGDVIRFLMDFSHLTFTQAVEALAARAGIGVDYDDEQSGPKPVTRDKIMTIGEEAAMVELETAVHDYFRQLAWAHPDGIRVARLRAETIVGLIDEGTLTIAGVPEPF